MIEHEWILGYNVHVPSSLGKTGVVTQYPSLRGAKNDILALSYSKWSSALQLTHLSKPFQGL